MNYKQLVQIYFDYRNQGLEILLYPCNQFMWQEPGSNEEVLTFAKSRSVQFPVMAKTDVNGLFANPAWKYLRNNSDLKGDGIKWNFSKFLLNGEGEVVGYYDSDTVPKAIVKDIKKLCDSY